MRLIIGLTLILTAIPYAMYALTQGVQAPYLGIVTLVVAGGVLVARSRAPRRREDSDEPPSWETPIPPAPRLPGFPPLPPDDGTKIAPPLPPQSAPRRERETILPPKSAEEDAIIRRGHLRLVHSDGRPCDVRAPGTKKAAR